MGRIQSPKIIRIGGGVAKEIADVLKQLNLSRPLIVTDKNLVELGHVDLVLEILKKYNISWSIFDGVVEDLVVALLERETHALLDQRAGKRVGAGKGRELAEGDAVRRLRTRHPCRTCLLYTSPSPRDRTRSRMPSSA